MMKPTTFALALVLAACGANGKETEEREVRQRNALGVIEIGEVPKDMAVFKSSSCGTSKKPDFSDCTAVDAEGRNYVFFDGALARVSANRHEVTETLVLPARMEFGENIDAAAQKLKATLGVPLQWVESGDRFGYSSGFSMRSRSGVIYSVDLLCDDEKKLTEVVQSTDY